MCRGERVVLTGDFNVGETSDCHALLCESGILGDAYDAAPIRLATTGTENWFDPDVKTSGVSITFHNTRFPAVALRHSDRYLSSSD